MAYTGNYPCTKCENVQILQYTSFRISQRSLAVIPRWRVHHEKNQNEWTCRRDLEIQSTEHETGSSTAWSLRTCIEMLQRPGYCACRLPDTRDGGRCLDYGLPVVFSAVRAWSNRKSATHKPSSAIVRCKVELDNPPKDHVCTVNRFYIVCSPNGGQLYRILALVTPYDILECYLGIYTISVRHPKPLMVVPVSSFLHQVVIVPFANNIGDQDPRRCCIITASKGEEYRLANK